MDRTQRLTTRLNRLDDLNSGRLPAYRTALNAIQAWSENGSETELIQIRRPFLQGDAASGRPAPLSRLISSRGYSLKMALLMLFLAQTQKGGHRHILKVPLTARETGDMAWSDLIVSGAIDGAGSTSRRIPQKRAASARAAINRLARPDICLVEQPNSAGRVGRFDQLRLLQDAGPRDTGYPIDYTRPRPQEHAVPIPVEFFRNGWVFALEDSEIATYLMYRMVCSRGPARVSAAQREDLFGIKPSAWEQHWVLVDSGILHREPDPNRRVDGTFIDQSGGADPMPHVFSLLDHGLKEDALTRVWAAVDGRCQG